MPSVLVTGSARGIGRATVQRLAAAGWDVYAGVRKLEDADGLPGTPVLLDITNAEHVAALDGTLPARLDAVVNNAGIVVGAPIEAVVLDELRQQLEVNVTGQVAVTQAVLPRLRSSKGRVVFVSSVSGRVATPMTGPTARRSSRSRRSPITADGAEPWGIRVVLVEPARPTPTCGHGRRRPQRDRRGMSPEHRQLYKKDTSGMKR